MRSRALTATIFACLAVSCAAASQAAECEFAEWQEYKGTPLFRNNGKNAYFWITEHTSIDADGAPKAYHPDDVGKPCGASGAGLDCPANAGYPTKSWWPDVLARDPAQPNQAFVQTSGVGKGFFVSKTALFDRGNANDRDPAKYVDASTIPYIVFPGPFFALSGTGKRGDLGVAYHVTTKRRTAFVVADIGPDEPLGEASIALFQALGGNNPNPRTGAGVAAGPVIYMMFPRSVDARPKAWPLPMTDIDTFANALLDSVGGAEVLESCAAAHP